MSISADVAAALIARLKTVQTAAGFSQTVATVYSPTIPGGFQPMGGDLMPQDMPAVIFYQGPLKFEPQHGVNNVYGTYYLEVIKPFCADADMWDMCNAISKAIFGGFSDSTDNTSYRFHPAVVEPRIIDIIPDFGMLAGNRIWVVVLLIHYRVRYTNI